MMRSLYSGVAGLRNHQTRMDVIANNIANVNTTAYKSSRVVFQDIYSQTVRAASGTTATLGGTNPSQIGLGVTLAAIDVLHTTGAPQVTDNPSDLCIEGDGFFVIQGSDQLLYTRAGNLYVDANGNLVNTSGQYVMGLMGSYELAFDENDEAIMIEVQDTDPLTGELLFDADGNAIMVEVQAEVWVAPTVGANGRFTANDLTNLNVSGFLSIAFTEKGEITGLDENGERQLIGYVAMANFVNPAGLEKVGSSQYAASANSGDPVFCLTQTNGTGKLKPGALEMANVDLAAEFTDMIITQRGFQANSRIITTSDSMLEELVNLKR